MDRGAWWATVHGVAESATPEAPGTQSANAQCATLPTLRNQQHLSESSLLATVTSEATP